jgi:hypothetical protein
MGKFPFLSSFPSSPTHPFSPSILLGPRRPEDSVESPGRVCPFFFYLSETGSVKSTSEMEGAFRKGDHQVQQFVS